MNWKELFFEGKLIKNDHFLLLLISILYSVGIALSNTFVNIFIWKQSNSYIEIGVYNLVVTIWQPVTFFIAGFLMKKWNRVLILRIGIIILALFYLIILLFREMASTHLFLLGSLLGAGYGFYWLAFNVLTFEITEPETRNVFNSVQGALLALVRMITPLLASFIIIRLTGLTGYYVIFGLSLLTFLFGVACSFFISHRETEGHFQIKRAFQEIKYNSNWKNILYAHFFQGIREGSFFFLISILVYVTTKNEVSLGTFSLINAGVSFLCFSYVTKFLNDKHNLKYILIGGVILYLSVFLLIFKITYVTLMIYAAVISIGYSIIHVPYTSLTYNVIGRAYNARQYRVEYIVVREVFLNAGRMVSILIFLFFMKYVHTPLNLHLTMLLLGSGYFVLYFYVKKIKI